MVRGEWVDGAKGQQVWREWVPPRCKNGHTQWMPGHGGCGGCLAMGRVWRCRAEGCDDVVFDPDHVHREPS